MFIPFLAAKAVATTLAALGAMSAKIGILTVPSTLCPSHFRRDLLVVDANVGFGATNSESRTSLACLLRV